MDPGPRPFIPCSGTAQFELVYEIFDKVCENTIWLNRPDGWRVENLNDICFRLAQWWFDDFRTHFSTDIALFKVKALEYDEDPGNQGVWIADTPIVGTIADPALPNNCSIAISFRTGAAGRSNRGRNFLVGIPETKVAGNIIDGTYLGEIIDSYENMVSYIRTASGDSSITHVVASFLSSGVWRSACSQREVTNYIYSDVFMDSQRMRLTGRHHRGS